MQSGDSSVGFAHLKTTALRDELELQLACSRTESGGACDPNVASCKHWLQ